MFILQWESGLALPWYLFCYRQTNKFGAIAWCLVGLVSGISVWLMSAYILYGEVSISSTGEDITLLLFENITSISAGAALAIFISVIRPANYRTGQRWAISKEIGYFQLSNSLCTNISFSHILYICYISLYFSGYIFSATAFSVWVWIAVMWVIG
jgi:urea-proton symporter